MEKEKGGSGSGLRIKRIARISRARFSTVGRATAWFKVRLNFDRSASVRRSVSSFPLVIPSVFPGARAFVRSVAGRPVHAETSGFREWAQKSFQPAIHAEKRVLKDRRETPATRNINENVA